MEITETLGKLIGGACLAIATAIITITALI